jgi:hypothetical protein
MLSLHVACQSEDFEIIRDIYLSIWYLEVISCTLTSFIIMTIIKAG